MKKSSTPAQKRRKSANTASPSDTSITAATSRRLEVISLPKNSSAEAPHISTSPELRSVRFGYFQPDAREVFVVGSFNGWNARVNPLRRDALGDWSVELELPPGEYRYRLMVDGEWRDDPSARQTAMNPYGGFDAIVIV